MGFVRLFGEVSDDSPVAATAEELFGEKRMSSGSAENTNTTAIESDTLKMTRCIDKLAAEEQEVYRMVAQEKRSFSEIAELTHREESDVRELFSSARSQLTRLFFEN